MEKKVHIYMRIYYEPEKVSFDQIGSVEPKRVSNPERMALSWSISGAEDDLQWLAASHAIVCGVQALLRFTVSWVSLASRKYYSWLNARTVSNTG